MQPPPSSAPPPGYPVPPPARKGLPTWAWVLIGCIPLSLIAVIAILAAILFPVFAHAREKARQISCASNERQMSLGLLQYAQDNDQHYPTAAAWMDRSEEYVRSDQPYRCPSAWDHDPAKYGYAFNSKLGRRRLADLANPSTTTAIYDSTNLSRNAADPVTSQPTPGRHSDGNDIAFGDGHVKWTGGGSYSAGP